MRAYCQRCRRPCSVCLCDSVVPGLSICGRVVVIQHPNEAKKKLATVPLLQLSLRSVSVFRCRRTPHTQIAHIIEEAKRPVNPVPLVIIYLAPGARPLEDVVNEWKSIAQDDDEGDAHGDGHGEIKPRYTLLVLDGTWNEVREMWNKGMHVLGEPHGVGKLAYLPLDDDVERKDAVRYKLRVEPQEGCMSTLECIARALGVIEGDNGLTLALLRPLARLIELQKQFSPSLQDRAQNGDYIRRTHNSRAQRPCHDEGDGG